ncbi:MAG: menaquinone-dependent protoporphyrinogen IX dehydrogenase [Propionibacteriaceae bacterium]|jgi:menaquinone-dependent protoporphyrinogen oxidase|nr:menaquinone-dependent protoporphyrinogen IX dehydrogenase [Propionibacteriaceae bacterium]
MKRVLVVHGSRFGQSTKIARAVEDVLEAAGRECDFAALTKDTSPDPERHGALVLVTSVRYGYFDKNAYRLVERYRDWLDSVPTLLMTVSLTARKPEKRDPAVHSYTRKFLEKSGWTPTRTEVVAGALEYPRYNLFDRLAIQLIMTISKGETDKTATIEYTDWDQVRQAAQDFAASLG